MLGYHSLFNHKLRTTFNHDFRKTNRLLFAILL